MARLLTLTLSFLVLCGMLAPSPAAAWWNKSWTLRQKVEIEAPAGTADAKRVPVLVRLHSGIIDFSQVKRDGSDLRFVAEDDSTPLNFHIERFDRSAEIALIWVDMPTLPRSPGSGPWLYYGNAAATAVSNAAASYDANQSLVLHFSGAGGQPVDQSANRNAISAFSGQLVGDGLIGGGAAMRVTSQITLAPSASLAKPADAGMTWSAWVRSASGPGAAPEIAALFAKSGTAAAVQLELRAGIPTLVVSRQGAIAQAAAQQPLAPGVWTNLAIVVGPTESRLYVDGKAVGTIPGAVPELQGADVIGATATSPGFVGTIDEVSHANTDRAPALLAFAAQSQARNATVVRLTGKPEEEGAAGSGYLGILFAALTPDAWVVIGILAVMFVLSATVMVLKIRQIGATDHANRRFLDGYRKAMRNGDGWASIDDENAFGRSSLFRLFRAGRTELADAVPGHVLSPQTIDVVRAAMFAEQTRESQALSRAMVVLTIAISGGPFLGLLGTVVGVMITFAAIAAAGDVNINSIAPGIAAALLATVAGLAVAIPSLFGYNYLILRIRNLNNDMAVFVEEFVARTAKSFS